MHGRIRKKPTRYILVNCLPTAPSLSNILGLESLALVVGLVPEVAFDIGAGADDMIASRISVLDRNPRC
jgi:hypothetical protein